MKRTWLGSVGLMTLGLVVPTADGQQLEVIATNAPPKPVPVSIGTPVIVPASAVIRAQKADPPPTTPPSANPTVPPVTPAPIPQIPASTTDGAAIPLPPPSPVPSSGAPIFMGTVPPPGPVGPSAPCTNCAPLAPFDPALAPLPGGTIDFSGNRPAHRWYISGEYLYYWLRDGGLPPLVTAGPVNDRNAVPAVLNPVLAPDTQILYGNNSLNTQGRSGARFEFGRWFGQCRPWAIEGGLFFLGQRSADFAVGGDGGAGTPALGRPFFESNRGIENIDYFNYPGLIAGDVAISSTNNFYGAHIDWRRRMWCGCRWNVDLQLGFRYLNFDEDLNIVEKINFIDRFQIPTGEIFPAGVNGVLSDRFRVDNDFYGGMIGLTSSWNCGRWSLDLLTRVSLGTTRRELEISGSQTIGVPGQPMGEFVGGLLARPSNIGNYSDNTFSVVPEFGFNVGYQVTCHFKLFAGYNFLYWSNVWRAGDQIDRTVNLAGIPFAPQPGQGVVLPPFSPNNPQMIPAGDNRPAVLFKETDFWAQGINVGVQWTW